MRKIFSCVAGCALLSPVAGYAAGQDDDIVVTATRMPEDGRDVAASIDTLDTADLQAVSPIHPAELLNRVAGIGIHRGSGQEHLTAIRSPVLTGGAGAGSFLYLEDGVPLRAAGFANVNGLFEAGTEFAGGVEVVKGPGSVLYGSNAVHGLINILPMETTNNTEGYGKILVSDNGLVSTQASVSSGGLRGNLSIVSDNGFRDNSGFNQQKIQLRHDAKLGAWSLKTLASFQNLNQETAGFVQGAKAYRSEVLSRQNAFPEAYRDARSARLHVRADRQISDTKTLSLTPYARWTEIEFLRHFVPGQALEDNAHASVGLLSALYGEVGKANYVIGLDGEYTRGTLVEFQDNPDRFSFVQGEHYDYAVESAVISAYGQIKVPLSPRTKLSLGARADYTHYTYDNQIDDGVSGRFKRVGDRTDDYFILTPKIGLTHAVSDQISLYARLARGARAPQVSDLYSLQINQDPGDINVETLDSAELGVKGRFGATRIDIAAFAMAKDNFYFRNADGLNISNGKTDHLGLEMSIDTDVTTFLSVSGNLTLAEHRYAFNDIVGSASSSIIDGNQVDTAPNVIANVEITVRPIKAVSVGLEFRHMGDYFTDPGNTQSYPGHTLTVLRGNWDVTDKVSVFGRIDNVFDVAYADRADFAFGNERYFPGRSRTVFVGLKGTF